MTSNYHTPVTAGASNLPSSVNDPMGELDAQITTNVTNISTVTTEVQNARGVYDNVDARLDALTSSGANVMATLASNTSTATVTVGTGEADAFTVGAYAGYLVSDVVEYRQIDAASGDTITLASAPSGQIDSGTLIWQVARDFYDATIALLGSGGSATLANQVLWASGNMHHVFGYGAEGDGSTDDTTAIQAAIDAATTNGGTVWIPEGYTFVCSELELKDDVTITGGGTLSLPVGQTRVMTAATTSEISNVTVRNLKFINNAGEAGNQATAISPPSGTGFFNSVFEDLEIQGFVSGINLGINGSPTLKAAPSVSEASTTVNTTVSSGTTLEVPDSTGFTDGENIEITLDNGNIHTTSLNGDPSVGTGSGGSDVITLTDAIPSTATAGNTVRQSTLETPTEAGGGNVIRRNYIHSTAFIYSAAGGGAAIRDQSSHALIEANVVVNMNYGILAGAGRGVRIANNYIANCFSNNAIYCSGTVRATVTGNQIYNCDFDGIAFNAALHCSAIGNVLNYVVQGAFRIQDSENITIGGNSCYRCGQLVRFTNTSGGDEIRNIVVANNIFDTSHDDSAALNITPVGETLDGVLIEGNTFANVTNTSGSTQQACIYVNSLADNVIIDRNIFTDATSGCVYFIYDATGAAEVVAEGNISVLPSFLPVIRWWQYSNATAYFHAEIIITGVAITANTTTEIDIGIDANFFTASRLGYKILGTIAGDDSSSNVWTGVFEAKARIHHNTATSSQTGSFLQADDATILNDVRLKTASGDNVNLVLEFTNTHATTGIVEGIMKLDLIAFQY